MCVIILRGCRGDGIVGEDGPAPGGPLINSRCLQVSCEGIPLGDEKVLSRSPSLRLHARPCTKGAPAGKDDVDTRQWRDTIAAAQDGDRRALDELVEGWLPLVYNIVGRALNGHADVDDVVQETMLRAVGNLGSLRDPESFRSWLVAIAMRQIRDRARRRTTAPLDESAPRGAADFAELTVLRLQLEGQRREVAEAVRWLDDEDRQLLSLWWLEVAGELTRRELAAAVGISRQHAAVRVQRMKERLETSRGIVRALDGACPHLRELTARIEAVIRRSAAAWRSHALERNASETRDAGHIRINFRSRTVTVAGQPTVLTRTEFDILELLSSDPGRVFGRGEIMTKVWGHDGAGDTRTLGVHISGLRKKLGLPNVIETVRGIGFRLITEDDQVALIP